MKALLIKIFSISSILLLSDLLAAAYGPSWWEEYGVIESAPYTNDFAPANQGQLKNFALQAQYEFEERLPGGAGSSVHQLISGFSNSLNYAFVNVGMLKNVAKPFYDRLIAVGYTNNYPWLSAVTQNYSLVNIGQIKNLFSFDLSGKTNIAGNVSYFGSRTGTIFVIATTSFEDWSTSCCSSRSSPGPFTITGLPIYVQYWVKSFCDVNGNKVVDYDEPWGEYTNNPVYLRDQISGVNLTLTDAGDADQDGMPDLWEHRYGLSQYSGVASNLGLVAWWKFDENTGTIVSNQISSNYTGQVVCGATWCAGRSGQPNDYALEFDGVDDHIQVLQSPCIITQSPFTVSAWVWYDTNQPARFPTVLADEGTQWFNSTTPEGYALMADTYYNHLGFSAIESRNHPTMINGTYVRDWREVYERKWTHLVGVYDGTNQMLYVNGCLQLETPSAFEPLQNPYLFIGRFHATSWSSHWKGKLDDIRIYRSALSGLQIADMYEDQADYDNDGESNYAESQHGTDPRDGGSATYTHDGAIDITFVPTNWSPTSPQRYLAYFNNDTSGSEIHLRVTADDYLEFIMYDAQGGRHSIRYPSRRENPGLMASHLILNDQTNRIVAAWRNLNSGQTNAEFALFVNGLDWQRVCGYNFNPKHTDYQWQWLGGYGYSEAAQVCIDFPVRIDEGALNRISSLTNTFPALAKITGLRVLTNGYGLVNSAVPPFSPSAFKTPTQFKRPQTLIQGIELFQWFGHESYTRLLQQAELNILMQQYAQYFDVAELRPRWQTWYRHDTQYLSNIALSMQATLIAAQEEGLAIALSSVDHYTKVMFTETNLMQYGAGVVEFDPSGFVSVNSRPVEIGPDQSYTFIDYGDRQAVSNYLAAWKREISSYTNYSFFFFNEDCLMWHGHPYTKSPTYSSNSLAWFREYVSSKYGAPYAFIKFPISPVDVNHSIPGYQGALSIASDSTNLLQITADPDIWAKWWEWRTVVFAHFLNQEVQILNELNGEGRNPNWKGAILFISLSTPWSMLCAVDMELLSKISHLDWMVMEQQRHGSYGESLLEQEVKLQLDGLKTALTNGTEFGSFAEVMRTVNSSMTCRIDYMTQDLVYAISPRYESKIIVPYDAAILIDRPVWTGYWSFAHYVPEASEAWNTIRFRDLWEGISNLNSMVQNIYSTQQAQITVSWSMPEQVIGYELHFSTNYTFSTTNRYVETSTNWYQEIWPVPMEDLYWRVRGKYKVIHIETNGIVRATNIYYGAWAENLDPIR